MLKFDKSFNNKYNLIFNKYIIFIMNTQLKEFFDYQQRILAADLKFDKERWYIPLNEQWDITLLWESDFHISQIFFKWKNDLVKEDDVNKVIKLFYEILKELVRIKNEIKNNTWLNKTLQKMLLNSVNRHIMFFIMRRYWIYLEAKKWWCNIPDEIVLHAQQQIDKIQTILYWPKVSDVDHERDSVVSLLADLFEKNKNKTVDGVGILSDEEKTFFEKQILQRFQKTVDKKQEIKETETKKNKPNVDLKRKISSERLKDIFEIALDIYWLQDWEVCFVDSALNVSVEYKKRKIKLPTKKKEYTIREACKLIDHEISIHAVRGENTLNTTKLHIWSYMDKEEWLAKISDWEFSDIEDINVPWLGHISTFIWENFGYEDTYRLLLIYFKLKDEDKEKAEKKAKDRTLRIKEYNFDWPWAYRKNASYYRWLNFLFNYLWNIDPKEYTEWLNKFYFSKLWDEEFQYVDELKEIMNVNNEDIKKPLWLWKILFEKLVKWKGWLIGIEQRDKRFVWKEELVLTQKRQLVNILTLLRGDV